MSTTQAELPDAPTLTVGAANKTIVQRMDLIATQTAYDRTFLDMLNGPEGYPSRLAQGVVRDTADSSCGSQTR